MLEAWYPGQQYGNAIAAVLFGDVDPSGKLPVTFPASDTQGPALPSQPERYPGVNGDERYDEGILVGYRWYDANGQRPLFPFGYGLSYTALPLRDLRVTPAARRALVVRARDEHRPARRPEVVQLYVGFPPSAGEPPRQLKGYRKVALGPGQSRTLSLRLTRDDLAVFDGGSRSRAGDTRVFVGTSSRDLPLRAASCRRASRRQSVTASGGARPSRRAGRRSSRRAQRQRRTTTSSARSPPGRRAFCSSAPARRS